MIEEKTVEVVEVIPKPISYTVSAVGSLKTIEDVPNLWILSTAKPDRRTAPKTTPNPT